MKQSKSFSGRALLNSFVLLLLLLSFSSQRAGEPGTGRRNPGPPCYTCSDSYNFRHNSCRSARDDAQRSATIRDRWCIGVCLFQMDEINRQLCNMNCVTSRLSTDIRINSDYNRCIDNALNLYNDCRRWCRPY